MNQKLKTISMLIIKTFKLKWNKITEKGSEPSEYDKWGDFNFEKPKSWGERVLFITWREASIWGSMIMVTKRRGWQFRSKFLTLFFF